MLKKKEVNQKIKETEKEIPYYPSHHLHIWIYFHLSLSPDLLRLDPAMSQNPQVI